MESSSSQLSLTRVRCTLPAAKSLAFTPDGSSLVVVTHEGFAHLAKLDSVNPQLLKSLDPLPGTDRVFICLTAVCLSGRYMAICDNEHHIHIYHTKKQKFICSLPTRSSQPLDIAFHPTQSLLLVAYADRMVTEFDISHSEFTSWSRQFTECLPLAWSRRHNKIRRLFYHPHHCERIVVCDDEAFCIIDKSQKLPDKSVKLFHKSYSTKAKARVGHAIHVCERFKYLMHVSVLPDDSLIIVERPLDAVLQSLPDPLHRKKFGV